VLSIFVAILSVVTEFDVYPVGWYNCPRGLREGRVASDGLPDGRGARQAGSPSYGRATGWKPVIRNTIGRVVLDSA